jgi:L-ribulokinase
MGIEAGQSAVGDLFNWCVSKLGGGSHESLEAEASNLAPGASGLLALDWNNGNRTILVDPMLSGLLVGQTLQTTQFEIYRALIEATAFGARRIIEHLESHGVSIEEIVVCGGLAEKSRLVMQVYADVCKRPLKLSKSSQTCALGAAICGGVVGGVFASVDDGVERVTGTKETSYAPDGRAAEVYDRLYVLYSSLHDAFGVRDTRADLYGVMKQLAQIRMDAAKAKGA